MDAGEEDAADPIQADLARIVHEQTEAYNARDLERFVNCYGPEAVVVEGEDAVIAQGRDAIRDLYAPFFAQSPTLHGEVLTCIAAGEWVITEEQVTGAVIDGTPRELHAAVLYHIRGDRS